MPAISKRVNELPPTPGHHRHQAAALEPAPASITLTSSGMSLSKGRDAKAIFYYLAEDYAFCGNYHSVKRFVGQLRGRLTAKASAIIVTPPGENLS